MKLKLSACLVLLVFAFVPLSSFGQGKICNPMPCPTPTPTSSSGGTQWEINPYAGWYWSGTNASGVGRFFNTQYLGVRGGGYITHSFELGGNWNWTNHFQPNQSNTGSALAGALGFPQGSVRANLWEAEYTYHFANRSFFGSAAVRPYVVGSTGGITTNIRSANNNEDTFVLNVVPRPTNQGVKFFANDVFDDHDTFFTFSYGGGVKGLRVWGPMGFFGDLRGRTIPNFFGSATTRTELSGGLTFSWGER
jgi:hypothetical protein